MDLMQDYKKEPGGKEKLKERNPKWINDDYVKFIRYSQHYIEKNGSGVLAFINPHGFLDNPTFRGMRWNLLKTYDKIYTIDLHGNSKKKEICPDGSPDQNVFDIMQGLSINLFIKTGKKKSNELGKVFHYDLYGKRDFKYNYLYEDNLNSIKFIELSNKAPNYFMVQKDFELEEEYNNGIILNDLFRVNNVGIVTSRDGFVIDEKKEVLSKRIECFFELPKTDLLAKYNLRENRSWKIDDTKSKANNFDINDLKKITCRPFDNCFVYYNSNFIERGRNEVMKHYQSNKNLGLVVGRQGQVVGNMTWNLSFITNSITDFNLYYRGGGNLFPLYLYPEIHNQQTIDEKTERKSNLNQEIVNKISKKLSLTFTNEKEEIKDTFAPIDILDYIYAVLHSPTYREKHKEFLKIDFPRVPYPKDEKTFWDLVKLGKEVREIHLLESNKVEDYITSYEIVENVENDHNVINTKIGKKDWKIIDNEKQLGRIWINENKYFDNVPLTAWEFYIGGYQPAQKWLKDRKERELKFEDILHYQKIIVALTETDRIMKEIDKIEIE